MKVLKGNFVLLIDYNFVYERILFIPCDLYWIELYESEWIRINPTIKGML